MCPSDHRGPLVRLLFLATLSLLLVASPACRGRGASVSPELRSVVGRELSIDASHLDPDVSLVAIKPTIGDVETVSLLVSLEAEFNVDIPPDASFDILGARAHQAPTKLTLRNLAQLVASAPRAQARPATR
jgi:hypothetical protein